VASDTQNPAFTGSQSLTRRETLTVLGAAMLAGSTPVKEAQSGKTSEDRALPQGWLPYGSLNNFYRGRINQSLIPQDWQALSSPEPTARDAAWRSWRSGVLRDLAEVLWPLYDWEHMQWVGSATNFARDLTRCDLAIMVKMLNPPEGRRFLKPPESPNLAPNPPDHKTLFEYEDGKHRFGADYGVYDVRVPQWLSTSAASIMNNAIDTKIGSVSLQFKVYFQRIRPYQVAMAWGLKEFEHELALTSMSPALPSGHGLQGLIAAASVYETWIEAGLTMDKSSIASLGQFAVDVGDRRVMAGIHYPSDNIASWILALLLGPLVFRRTDTTRFLWSAIHEQSHIYKLIAAMIQSGEGGSFEPSWKYMQKLGSAL
jgi:PAP2 superfamily